MAEHLDKKKGCIKYCVALLQVMEVERNIIEKMEKDWTVNQL